MEQPYLSVVIPAYNEANRIGRTLDAIKNFVDTFSESVEILVVINNTTDNTASVVSKYQKMLPIRSIDIGMIESESGTKGYAVHTGMLEAKGEYIVFMDADNATDLSEIKKMLPFTAQGFDVVCGSRYIRGAKTNRSWYRNIMGRLSNVLVQAVLLPGIYDTQCGFKLFTNKAAQSIFKRSELMGWGFDIEVLAIARVQHMKIKEVPVEWNEIGHSSVKAGAFVSSLKELFQVRRNVKRGKYI